jgi:UDP-glucuronate decarboxylase
MRRILLSGAAGFLGSHLTDELLATGNFVFGLDNFYTGSEENISQHSQNPNFQILNQNVIEPLDVDVDYILNFACPASPVHYQRNPVQTLETSILGTANLLHLAQARGIPILQASTSEVYGDPLESPQTENYWGNVNPIGVRACYDEGKRAAETLMFDYHRQYGVQIRIVRIFNTYGPRMNLFDGRVVSNFVRQSLKDEDITLYGDGLQTRSFCYVTDLVRGIMSMIESSPHIMGPINLGNPVEHTMRELAELIIKKTNSKSRLVHSPLPQDDPQQRKPDITKAKTLLNWTPVVSLSDGLNFVIDDFSQRIRM